ncbi:hypothetical protein WAI453_011726 [Rhynchosporium graminicola]
MSYYDSPPLRSDRPRDEQDSNSTTPLRHNTKLYPESRGRPHSPIYTPEGRPESSCLLGEKHSKQGASTSTIDTKSRLHVLTPLSERQQADQQQSTFLPPKENLKRDTSTTAIDTNTPPLMKRWDSPTRFCSRSPSPAHLRYRSPSPLSGKNQGNCKGECYGAYWDKVCIRNLRL